MKEPNPNGAKMNIKIRSEEERDYHAVENLTREAFWNLYFPGCSEHYLVHTMRNHPDFIKELAFVAELDGELIGNIMYTRAWLLDAENQKKEIVSFGPLSVLPRYQRKGVGSALIEHSIRHVVRRSIDGIVIFGDPHNYCKHGFKSGKDLNISDMNGEYPYGMLALELKENALSGNKWKYVYSDLYNINEEELGEFDRAFARKEKEVTYTQEIFSIAFRSYVK
jgi:predicted N-acetyltransferase YhbS